jgi:minor histocompatibility antigen H13
VLFPRDFLVKGIYSTNFAMLGLGDIVLPGIVVALLLRFDQRCVTHGLCQHRVAGALVYVRVCVRVCACSRKEGASFYFNVTMVAYTLGLITTIAVMHTFKAAQVCVHVCV